MPLLPPVTTATWSFRSIPNSLGPTLCVGPHPRDALRRNLPPGGTLVFHQATRSGLVGWEERVVVPDAWCVCVRPHSTAYGIDVERAGQLGLVSQVVPDDELLPTARALAARMTVNAPLAVQASLRFAELSTELPASELLRQMTIEQHRIYGSRDFAEGMTAFAQKRKPNFTGQ